MIRALFIALALLLMASTADARGHGGAAFGWGALGGFALGTALAAPYYGYSTNGYYPGYYYPPAYYRPYGCWSPYYRAYVPC